MDIDRLVSRAQSGDADAFGAIYDIYAERVYQFILVRVGQPADAEDLLQQVFLKVVESLPRYEQRGFPFGAWVFRIARNAVIDFGRARRDLEHLGDDDGWAIGPVQPGDLVERAADLDAIRVALGELTREQRDVIVFRFFGGLSHAEIGVLIGKREGTVRVIQHRALEALRRRIDGPQRSMLMADEA